jgi:3,4-dihydroxy 2-butanone 4-phosphate synthase/GTP cyclohydrolase II
MPLATIEEAIKDLQRGRMVIIVDDEDRENEGDLCCAAEFITPDIINFMATHGRGLICLSLEGDRLDELQIPMMVSDNTSAFGTAFCVSIEARENITTGISAFDRAQTIKTALNPDTKPEDLARPGHIFPLRAKQGGVLRRAGQTEASVDLARLAGLKPAGVICEIMNSDGTMSRLPQLEDFAEKHELKIISVAELIAYRLANESLVRRVASPKLPTQFGDFRIIAYENDQDDFNHLALVMGNVADNEPVLCRVHSECLTGDIFASQRCDCGPQLHKALELIAEEGRGVLLYLRQEGRGIGLVNKLKAYEIQDQGYDTVDANLHLGFKEDQRDYGIGAQILYDLGVRRMRLMSNNPTKFIALNGYGLEIVERVSIEIEPNANNFDYLETKKRRMGHMLEDI